MATTAISKTGVTAHHEGPAAAPNLRTASDDEILNLSPRAIPKKKIAEDATPSATEAESAPTSATTSRETPAESPAGTPDEIRAALEEHPELRSAWEDAAAYREAFASPKEAREATRLVSDLNRLDALFFSSRPEDHAELARVVSELDPAAAASLAWALSRVATEAQSHGEASRGNLQRNLAPHNGNVIPGLPDQQAGEAAAQDSSGPANPGRAVTEPRNLSSALQAQSNANPTPAQAEFFHAANAAAVEGVLDAIHSQVDRLLPEGTSQAARNRVVGEIYRELDTSLRSNRQLAEQLRQAFKSGALDAAHQRGVVSLITGRARQALPGVAKRVMNEWTAALVSSGVDRRARQRAAESRVDIGGSGRSGSDGRRTLSPREIDYSRLSDADILNL